MGKSLKIEKYVKWVISERGEPADEDCEFSWPTLIAAWPIWTGRLPVGRHSICISVCPIQFDGILPVRSNRLAIDGTLSKVNPIIKQQFSLVSVSDRFIDATEQIYILSHTQNHSVELIIPATSICFVWDLVISHKNLQC